MKYTFNHALYHYPMNTTETILDYHQRTKHHPKRYAASLGYMDWATQPNPFRHYDGAPKVKLPLAFNASTPTYSEVMEEKSIPQAPLTLASISQLLQFSLGIAAWKCLGEDCWALRCNASSGNLQPTEATLVLPPLEGLSSQSVVVHYNVQEHALEILAEFETVFWQEHPESHYFVALSSIPWREMWKYGERCYRYVNLDLGHALKAVKVSVQTLGEEYGVVEEIKIADLEKIIGLNQRERYHESEPEIAQLLLSIGESVPSVETLSQLIDNLPKTYVGKANLLSPAHHPWEAVTLAMQATQIDSKPSIHLPTSPVTTNLNSKCSTDIKEILLKRRSAQAMDFARTKISLETFRQLLASVKAPVDNRVPRVNFALFIHDVEELEKGLYFYLRNPEHKSSLKRLSRNDFQWQEVEKDLYLLETGDFRSQAKFISCSQDIASDGAFSLAMITQFEEPVATYGASEYKRLYWECGEIGQQLYLEATALELSATGIGCYLDDVMHRMLGLEDETFQTMYHFTIGRAIIDTRMSMRKPYKER